MKDRKQRDSQFELLRIVAMFFIVIHHLVIKGADTVGYVTEYSIETCGYMGVLINSFVVGGVNLFVLITGWYGVKLKWNSFFRLIIDCIVFGFASYLLLTIISNHEFRFKELLLSGFFTKNWFVVSYMMLLLSSPMIEASIKNCADKVLLCWVVLLTILNLFFGYYLREVNTNGYNFVQFIWLYYIARYLRLTQDNKINRIISKYGICFYAITSIILAFLYVLFSYRWHTLDSLRWFAYNNPLLMLSSICLFMWFSHFNFISKFVNLMATGVFGVFLLHTTVYVQPYRNSFTADVFTQFGYSGVICEAIILFVTLCLISIVINKVNKFFISVFNDSFLKLHSRFIQRNNIN